MAKFNISNSGNFGSCLRRLLIVVAGAFLWHSHLSAEEHQQSIQYEITPLPESRIWRQRTALWHQPGRIFVWPGHSFLNLPKYLDPDSVSLCLHPPQTVARPEKTLIALHSVPVGCHAGTRWRLPLPIWPARPMRFNLWSIPSLPSKNLCFASWFTFSPFHRLCFACWFTLLKVKTWDLMPIYYFITIYRNNGKRINMLRQCFLYRNASCLWILCARQNKSVSYWY